MNIADCGLTYFFIGGLGGNVIGLAVVVVVVDDDVVVVGEVFSLDAFFGLLCFVDVFGYDSFDSIDSLSDSLDLLRDSPDSLLFDLFDSLDSSLLDESKILSDSLEPYDLTNFLNLLFTNGRGVVVVVVEVVVVVVVVNGVVCAVVVRRFDFESLAVSTLKVVCSEK